MHVHSIRRIGRNDDMGHHLAHCNFLHHRPFEAIIIIIITIIIKKHKARIRTKRKHVLALSFFLAQFLRSSLYASSSSQRPIS